MRTEVKTVTPEMARVFLSNNKNNRPVRDATVLEYASQIYRGLWRLTGQGISFDPDGFLLDGQHRLHAVIKSNRSIDTLIIYNVPSDTFNTYDSGKKRTAADVFSIEGIKNYTSAAATISKYLRLQTPSKGDKESFSRLKVTKSEMVTLYYKHEDLWIKLLLLGQRCYTKMRLMDKTYIAAIGGYLLIDKGHALNTIESFFYQMFTIEEETQRNTRMFREMIIKNALSTNKFEQTYKKAILIKAWNNYINRRKVKFLKFAAADKYPEFI